MTLPAFENSIHALRRFKLPTFLRVTGSGLTKADCSRIQEQYKAFYARQQARHAAYAEAEKDSAFFRQQAEKLITRLGYDTAPLNDAAPRIAIKEQISAASRKYTDILEDQYFARIDALGIAPTEAPPEGTPAYMCLDTEAAGAPEPEEAPESMASTTPMSESIASLIALRDTLLKYEAELVRDPAAPRNYSAFRQITAAVCRAYHHISPITASDDQDRVVL